MATLMRRRTVGLFVAASAWFGAGFLGGCRMAPAVAEISVGYGQGSEPNSITVANQILEETNPPAGPRIVVTVDPRPGPGPGALRLSDEVEHATRVAAHRSVIAVVGPGGSREALQVAPIYRETGLPQILPVATSSLLPASGPWTFRLAPSDSTQGEFIGDFVAHTLGGRAVTLFYLPDEYGHGLAAGTAAALVRFGVRLLDRVPVGAAARCDRPGVRNPYEDLVVASFRRARPDVVVVAGRGWETVCIARAAGAIVPGVRLVAGDGASIDPDRRLLAGSAADSIYLVAFWHALRDDPASKAFVERFRRAAGRAPSHGDAMWFDALMVVAAAIRAVGPDRSAVRGYLESLGRDRPPFAGVTGPIGFAPGLHRPMVMTRLAGRETVLAAP